MRPRVIITAIASWHPMSINSQILRNDDLMATAVVLEHTMVLYKKIGLSIISLYYDIRSKFPEGNRLEVFDLCLHMSYEFW